MTSKSGTDSGPANMKAGTNSTLREESERLKLALAATGLGTWEMDLVNDRRTWSDATLAMHGAKRPAANEDSIALDNRLMHPDDQIRLKTLHDELRAGRDDYSFEYRTTLANGEIRWILAQGKVLERTSEGPTRIVGICADITARKQPEETQRRDEEKFRILANAMPQLVWIADGEGRVTYYNDRRPEYANAEGVNGHAIDWQPIVHPEDLQATTNAWQVSRATGQDYEMEHRLKRADGSFAWHLSRAKPVRDDDGTIINWYGTATDIENLKRTEQTALTIAERLVSAERAASALVYDWDMTNGKVWRSNGLTRLLGWKIDELPPTPDAWHGLMHPEDRRRLTAQVYEQFLQPDDHYVCEYRVQHKQGHYVWLMDSGRVFRNAEGLIVRQAGATIDISARQQAEQSLRRKADLIELSFEPIFVWHPKDGILEWNKGAEQVYGYSRDEALGRNSHELLQTIHPVPVPQLLDQLFAVKSWTGEVTHVSKDGRHIMVESRHQLIETDGDIVVLETNHDISDRKEWEARQRLMTMELAHRVKNSFAVLQAILRSTLKSSPDPVQFAAAFSGRLHSLAATHDALTASDWKGAELGALIRHQLSHYVEKLPDRFALSGPVINMPPEHAAPLGLIINELATNATKYGALSAASGRVSVTWSKASVDGRQMLTLVWQETGGPSITKPSTKGFGTVLIEKSLAEAEVAFDYQPTGLICTIKLPLNEKSSRLELFSNGRID